MRKSGKQVNRIKKKEGVTELLRELNPYKVYIAAAASTIFVYKSSLSLVSI